jgi:hypothetical protein
MQRWAEVRGLSDVRMGVYVQRVRAKVLLARDDRPGALALAEAALAASQRYDAPGAASIAEARSLVQQAQAPAGLR